MVLPKVSYITLVNREKENSSHLIDTNQSGYIHGLFQFCSAKVNFCFCEAKV